jgi:UDP-N-acetylmuramoyl-tripeptide--D-alanyl-D-alanine ligase
LTRVVNDYLKPDHEVLIAEMGARNKGDIKKLASFIKPKYGILTSIGSQHLFSFGTVENIAKTKYELIEELPADGYAIFNGNSEGAYELYKKCEIDKCVTGNVDESCVRAENITIDRNGTHFTLKLKDGSSIKCTTKLIGKHNVENILMCTQVALALGLTNEQIKEGIAKLKPVPHRLELKVNENGVIIFDDSYNASVESIEVALEVVSSFGKDKKKIVVTPGLIELGKKEREENFNFGVKMAAVANYVIIVNKVNLGAIREGLESAGFDMENVYEAETLDKAKGMLEKLVSEGDVVLFENDLPDNYI